MQSFGVTLTPGATLAQDFQLVSDPLRLDEIVVTGAGSEQLRERLGSNVTSVAAAEVQRANESNVVQALAGKVPNVLTNQASGDAGASTAILIRGPKSFGTTPTGFSPSPPRPVIIVDGVPLSNVTHGEAVLSGAPSRNRAADINTEDIESIEILPGAASTSIYGASAGSAGAILITTKRGRPGQTTYSLRSSVQFDEPVGTLPVQRKYGVGSGGVSSNCTAVNCQINSNFFSWGPELDPATPTYDHGAEMFETGHAIENTLTLSGGSERTTFYLSAGQLNQNGFIVGDNDTYRRYSARFRGSHTLFENLVVSASVSVVQTKTSGEDRGNSINGIGISALRQPPDFNAQQYLSPTTGLHRSWRFLNPGPLAFATTRGFDNPFYALNEDALLGETGRYLGNLNVNWRPLGWLQLNWTLGGDYTSDDRTYAYAQASSGTNGGQMERWQFYDRLFDHLLTATGTHEFNRHVRGGLTVGQNLNETYYRQIDVLRQVWLAPKPFKLQNTTTRTLPNDAEQRRRVEGYFAQANVDLYDQLFLQGRIRNDANSAFGVGHQRAWYPGGSAAWSFAKAVHLPEQIVSFGKLRLAYGESGQQPPLYATQDVFTTTRFIDFNPGSLQGTTINGVGGLYASATRGNPDIKPERVREVEGGVDLGLFRGRADRIPARRVALHRLRAVRPWSRAGFLLGRHVRRRDRVRGRTGRRSVHRGERFPDHGSNRSGGRQPVARLDCRDLPHRQLPGRAAERVSRAPPGRGCAQHDALLDGSVRDAQGHRDPRPDPHVRQGHGGLQQNGRRAQRSDGRSGRRDGGRDRRGLVQRRHAGQRAGRHGRAHHDPTRGRDEHAPARGLDQLFLHGPVGEQPRGHAAAGRKALRPQPQAVDRLQRLRSGGQPGRGAAGESGHRLVQRPARPRLGHAGHALSLSAREEQR